MVSAIIPDEIRPAKHKGIICDECGAMPIVGIRYVATHLYEYDVCGNCLQENHEDDQDRFVAFDQPMGPSARDMCLVPDTKVTAFLARVAASKLEDNIESRCLCFSPIQRQNDIHDHVAGEALKSALKKHTKVDIVHAHMCHSDAARPAIIDLLDGIASNSSVKRVFLHISQANQEDLALAEALCGMIRESQSLECLLINRTCNQQYRTAMELPRENHDLFARKIFDGLRGNTRLKIFRLRSYTVLSKTTKNHLLDIIQNDNQTIKRVYADFDTAGEKVDTRQLDLLLACNRKKWVDRVAEIQKGKRQRLEVLQEALSAGGSELEPVSTAFHLLKTSPDLFKC